VKPGRVAVIDFEPDTLWLHGGASDGTRRPGHGVARADAIADGQFKGIVMKARS
jgi:hypothetical protein